MYFSQNRFFRFLCFCIPFLFLTAPFPTMTNNGEAHAFSVGEEREVGEKLLSIVRKEFKLLDDPDIAQYINELGKEILAIAGPQYFNFHFFVINNKEFNAFAAPSGLIFIHSGLIDITESEGELVSVLAHEVGHVASRHIADRIAKSSKLNIGTTAMILAGIALGGGPLSEALIAGSAATGATMSLKFSRQNEEEADRLAFNWMKAQGRDPAEMVSMLQKMRKVSRYRSGAVPAYLLTHPGPEQRINYIDDLRVMAQTGHYPQKDDFEFQRIKYRVLSLTKEPANLLPIFLKKVADSANDDKNIMDYYGLSQVYLAKRNFGKARESLHKLMIHYPSKPILTTDLGVTYFQSGQYAEALKLFQKAKDADPACTYTMYYYAQALQKTGDITTALPIYENLLELLPDYAKLYYHIGQIKAEQGSPGVGHYYLGLYFWFEGDSKTARFHLNEAINKLSENNEIRNKSQEMLKEIERLEKG